MFAVVLISGKQYIVSPGDVIEVDRIDVAPGPITFDRVLLICDEKGNVKIGKPIISGASISAKVIAEKKGTKLHIRRFKSKVRYRKAMGFRPIYTQIEIIAIKK